MSEISVIVPVYNVEKYLPRCVDSILGQTFCDFELILIDDGSTDSSGRICDDYAAHDSRIRVIHQENRGQAAARNRALDIAQGEYIGFVDSDDYIHPQMYEILMRHAREHDADISVCCCRIVHQGGMYASLGADGCVPWSGKDFLKHCLLNHVGKKPWVLWDKIFRRSCFASLRMPEGRINEDNAVVYKALYEAACVVDCGEELYYYFQHDQSTVNQRFAKKHLDWLLVLEEMLAYFEKKNDDVLLDKMNRSYLFALEDLYGKAKAHLHDRKAEKELLGKLRVHWQKERKRYPISIKTHPGVYEILFPAYSRIYWTAKGVISKITGR